MKKFILLLGLVVITTASSASHENENDFKFPEYSASLDLGVIGGCEANCGMTSCSGSGNCVCSCDSFSCSCTNNDKLPSEPTGVSINQQQYENIKDLAKLLYFSDDSNANRAYVHLSEMIQSLKDKDHEIFHKEKESYSVRFLTFLQILSKEN